MKSNIVIRQAVAEDAEQFVKLKNLVWKDAYKNIFPKEVFDEQEASQDSKIKYFKENMVGNKNNLIFVAECLGNIVGLISGSLLSNYEFFKNNGYADLTALYIHPDYQGLGISSKFKNMFEHWAKQNNATKPAPYGPHWDWKDSNGQLWRLYRFWRTRK